MLKIMLLAMAMVLALSMGLAAHAEETAAETEAAVSTPAYIFWQDNDWWPAAWAEEDDYWTPVPAMVTGEGWYTVKLEGHMPSWFYSGGNSNIGAQKLAIVIKDGHDLFPGMYMQIVDIRVDGVSYPCGAVTYGQTGYDNINDQEGGKVYWDANDTYGLIWDQWMIDNGGTVDTGVTWDSTAAPQKFDVFDVSVLKNPGSIEIDFFLSAQQDVKPEGGPALRVLGEGPAMLGKRVALSSLIETPANATKASLFYWAGGWWPVTDGVLGTTTSTTIKGEGEYTVDAYFLDQGGWTPTANGAKKLLLIVEDGKNGEGTVMDGMYLGISDVRVNGNSIDVGNAAYGPTWYTGYANEYQMFDDNDGYVMLYDEWQMASSDSEGGGGDGLLVGGHQTWDGSEGVPDPINPDDLVDVSKVEVDFFVTDEQGKRPEPPVLKYDYKWYPNNTMGVAGISLRDKGITNKWYNVCPVDLTRNGIYKIPLVASNMYVIGNAIVAVEGDQVTVTYETRNSTPGNLVIKGECLKWFASLEEVTDEFCQNPESDLAFGQAFSKAELGNVGYLFICNQLTYSQPIHDKGIFLDRYLPKDKEWVDYRAALDAMVAELGE